ncbi:hypothetical protein C8N38_105250 [Rhodovulum kholense]|uniref:Uncharacterized protein n=2 Tax=Rhodovulum kholense TaxID=453584 RepID=A0A8E3AR04_9RHOB|nr:hypothetical protein C8N38_105250 [Rhodovulum kholense]
MPMTRKQRLTGAGLAGLWLAVLLVWVFLPSVMAVPVLGWGLFLVVLAPLVWGMHLLARRLARKGRRDA